MVNEFHAALVNRRFETTSPGSDFIPSAWRPRALSAAASNIQRALLVQPQLQSACNWRSVELRRLISRSDLGGYLNRFDRRTGYAWDDLLHSMTSCLRLRVVGGDTAKKVTISHRPTAASFTVFTWTIVVDETNWNIISAAGSNSGSVSGQTSVTTALPGTDVQVTFPADNNATFVVTLAAAPKTTVAQTAKQLSEELRPHVSQLQSEPSVLESSQLAVLTSIVLGSAEPAAKVAAATILLVGNVLAAPEGLATR